MPSSSTRFHLRIKPDHAVSALLCVGFLAIVVYYLKRVHVRRQAGADVPGGHEGFQVAPSLATSPCTAVAAEGDGALPQGPASVDYTMGRYDGVLLSEPSVPEVPSATQPASTSIPATVFGHRGPVVSPLSVPSPDRSAPGSEPMFMFESNKASPYCCPSTYSTSTGCVCMTPEQETLLGAHGAA